MLKAEFLDAEDWRLWRNLRLKALAEAPYAFGSTLAEWQGEGDRESRWRDRLAAVPLNIVAELDGLPIGMVSATGMDRDGTVELISMWIDPIARGQGVGDFLMQAVLTWARSQGAKRVTLDVTEGNDYAAGLYRRHGFVDLGSTSNLERRMSRHLTGD